LLALAVVTVAVAACGDDDDDMTVNTAPATTTATTPATAVSTTAASSAPPATTGDAAPSSPEDVVESYFAAIAANDGAAACELVNPDDMSNLDTDPASCPDDLSNFPDEDRAIFAEVEIVGEVLVESENCDPGNPDEGNTAVEISARGENECIDLVLVGDKWLIEDL
jgi:hypothetical protein